MREMSRLSCKVDVYRDGICKFILACLDLLLISSKGSERDSTDLVIGDLVNLSSSQLTLVPADMFLLSGDAIVNESMLTGESVPVSKVPSKDEDLNRWREEKTENSKVFLYCGTKIVRVRGNMSSDGQMRPASAVVARTGFDTTKGALVRSMLFPKPIGFKFYRDSVRFILVLAGIAVLGFSFSAIQFIRIGVSSNVCLYYFQLTLFCSYRGIPSWFEHWISSLWLCRPLYLQRSRSERASPSVDYANLEFSASPRLVSTSQARSTSAVLTRPAHSRKMDWTFLECVLSTGMGTSLGNCWKTFMTYHLGRKRRLSCMQLRRVIRSRWSMESLWAIRLM